MDITLILTDYNPEIINLPIETSAAGIRMIEMCIAFSEILPITDIQNQKQLSAITGIDLANKIPSILTSIGLLMLKDPEKSLGYLVWMGEAIDYIFGKRDKFPVTANELTEDVQRRVRKYLTSMKHEKLENYGNE